MTLFSGTIENRVMHRKAYSPVTLNAPLCILSSFLQEGRLGHPGELRMDSVVAERIQMPKISFYFIMFLLVSFQFLLLDILRQWTPRPWRT